MGPLLGFAHSLLNPLREDSRLAGIPEDVGIVSETMKRYLNNRLLESMTWLEVTVGPVSQ